MAVCVEHQAIYFSRRKSIKGWSYSIAACTILLLALAVKVAVKVQITDLGYTLAREEAIALELDEMRRDLDLQLSVMNRKDNLRARAKAVLGLGDFNPAQARYID